MARWQFALWCLSARFSRENNICPYCKSTRHKLQERKKLLIEARRCQHCGLIFRWPVDSAARARRFYERDYRSGKTTQRPSPEELERLRTNGFRNSQWDRPGYVELVRQACPPPVRLLDFGASWGYFGCQLQRIGYGVEGFEVSPSRAEFGRRGLRLPIYSSWEELLAQGLPRYDVIFTAHTLEHVYDLREVLNRFRHALVPEGALVIVVPNAGGEKARRLGVRWGPFIGETHTIAFEAKWLKTNLPRHGFEVLELFSLSDSGKDAGCEGEELVCTARRKK